MLGSIYDKLAPDVRALVDEVENRAGFEIEVKAKFERRADAAISEAIGEEVVGTIVGAKSMVIESPTTIEAITEEDYIHELLHLRRTFVENVVQLYPRKAADGNAAASVDNWLEHAIIYGQHIKMRSAYQSKMDAGLKEFWEKSALQCTGISLKMNLLSRFMVTQRYGLLPSKVAMSKTLALPSMPFNVRSFGARCLGTLDDKRQLVSMFLSMCGIPTELFWLRWYNFESHKFDWAPI